MKTLRYLAVIIAGIFFFAACQKELSFESGFPNSPAKGSLKSVTGDCQPITIKGVYKQDSTLGDSNYVTIQGNFTVPGTYNITTDTQNGFSFRDSSFVIDTGLQTIKLRAKGRPILAQQTDFVVAFDTSFCMFSVQVMGTTNATYTLVGTATSCSNSSIQGTYTVGTALSAANKVNLQVNVTSPGGYSITTPITGGMTFSASGTFAFPGIQTVSLQGSGTPTTQGLNAVPVSTGTSSCSFAVNVVAGSGGGTNPNVSDSAWQFTQGTRTFKGPFFSVDTARSSGVLSLIFTGITSATRDSVLTFGTIFAGGAIQPGTYNTNTFAAFYFENYSDTANPQPIFTADASTSGANVQITISSYDSATGIVSGTFSGPAFNASNAPVQITGGKFRGKIR